MPNVMERMHFRNFYNRKNLCKEEQATVQKSLPGCCGFVNIFVTAGMPSFVLVECFLLEVAPTSSNARISGKQNAVGITCSVLRFATGFSVSEYNCSDLSRMLGYVAYLKCTTFRELDL